jgi:hypothetical protein
MPAHVPALPPQIIIAADYFNASMKTAALPYSSELLPLVKASNYLIGHGYPVVPAFFNKEETLLNATEYRWDFPIIPRDNETSTVIAVNRIHHIKISGTAGDGGSIEVRTDAITDVNTTTYEITADRFGKAYWSGYIIQNIDDCATIATSVSLLITPITGTAILESYSCFELPRYQLNPVSAARGVDDKSMIKRCSIFTGTTNKSCNQLFSTDPLLSSRRVLFCWGAEQ